MSDKNDEVIKFEVIEEDEDIFLEHESMSDEELVEFLKTIEQGKVETETITSPEKEEYDELEKLKDLKQMINEFQTPPLLKLVKSFKKTIDCQMEKIEEFINELDKDFNELTRSQFKNNIQTHIPDVELIQDSLADYIKQYKRHEIDASIWILYSNVISIGALKSACEKVYENDYEFEKNVRIAYTERNNSNIYLKSINRFQ